jgi:hypothetical protein
VFRILRLHDYEVFRCLAGELGLEPGNVAFLLLGLGGEEADERAEQRLVAWQSVNFRAEARSFGLLEHSDGDDFAVGLDACQNFDPGLIAADRVEQFVADNVFAFVEDFVVFDRFAVCFKLLQFAKGRGGREGQFLALFEPFALGFRYGAFGDPIDQGKPHAGHAGDDEKD